MDTGRRARNAGPGSMSSMSSLSVRNQARHGTQTRVDRPRGPTRNSEERQNRDVQQYIVLDPSTKRYKDRLTWEQACSLARGNPGLQVIPQPDSRVATCTAIAQDALQRSSRGSERLQRPVYCNADTRSKTPPARVHAPQRAVVRRSLERPQEGADSGPTDMSDSEDGDRDSSLSRHLSTALHLECSSQLPSASGTAAGRSRGSNSGTRGSHPSHGGTSASSTHNDSSGRSGHSVLSDCFGGSQRSQRKRQPTRKPAYPESQPHHSGRAPYPANGDPREGRSGEAPLWGPGT